ncbi:MAG: PilX N-terminal domain-containing pilus assembly protein [Pseudomonadota bacterium]|nr:PilX N-terminal domain-containing pilus assembly protein [Pseudomonadota bacterium]
MTAAMQTPGPGQRQEGWVLIIGLVILAMMSTLGISLMRNTQLEEKMAGASREINLSFQAAESALRDAEEFIEAQTNDTVFNTTGNGIYKAGSAVADTEQEPFTAALWDNTDSREYGTAGVLDLAGVAADPRYMIKKMMDVGSAGEGSLVEKGAGTTDMGSSVTVFRITARGTGGSGAGGRTILRTYYGKAFN